MSNQEIIRRRQYCQIIKEISGSDQYLVVGIDVGKETNHAFMGSTTGVTFYRKLIFGNNIGGFSRLNTIAGQIKDRQGLSKVVFGLEPTIAFSTNGSDCGSLRSHNLTLFVMQFTYFGFPAHRLTLQLLFFVLLLFFERMQT